MSLKTEIYDDVPLSVLLQMESFSNEKLASEKLANQLREENDRLKSEMPAKERDRKLFFDLYQNVVQFVPQLALQYCHFETEVTEEFYQQKIQSQNYPENRSKTHPISVLENLSTENHSPLVQKRRPIAKARKRHHRIQPKYFKCKSADGTSELEVILTSDSLNPK